MRWPVARVTQVCAGLRAFLPPEALREALVCVVANLVGWMWDLDTYTRRCTWPEDLPPTFAFFTYNTLC